ncbi:MAG TPA: ABC transporter permease [Vicinamibacterales bacterium]|jgi:predicted permease
MRLIRIIWADALQDLRHALRVMRRDVGVTALIVLIAGLGIGASTVVFSVVNALVLRPLPFSDPSRLVWIANTGPDGAEWSTQVGHYVDLRAATTSFVDLAGWFGGYRRGDRELTGAGEPERLTSVAVTQNFFALLGVEPFVGRSFSDAESRANTNAPPAVILSFGFWRRRFASDPGIVGRVLTLDNRAATVVGVLPASFDFASIFAPGEAIDLFTPWPLTDETSHRGNTMKIVGRLAPNSTLAAAQVEFASLADRLNRQHPERNALHPTLTMLSQRVSGTARPALAVLAGAVGVVMLIVCVNLSNLQLARMSARRAEMATRAALGAGHFRLLRLVLTESLLLAGGGAVFGVVIAISGTRALAAAQTFDLPLLNNVRIDERELVVTALAAVVTGVLFGILPAWQLRGLTVGGALTMRGVSTSDRQAWTRRTLIVSEIAFACVLVVGAGLLVRSFARLLDVNLGFRPEQTATLRVDPSFRVSSFAQQNAYIDDLLGRARSVHGVFAAGLTDALPFSGDRAWQVGAKGDVYPAGQTPEAFVRIVSDGYFEAAGIAVRRGRAFTQNDRASSEPVAIVNETLAHTLWQNREAVGQMLTQDGGRRVVGVVVDVRHAALEAPGGAEMYLPFRQTSDYSSMVLLMRTAEAPAQLAPDLRSALRHVDPNLPLADVRTLRTLVDRAISPRRFLVLLVGSFAVFALFLAALGTYGVVANGVHQRRRELAIRAALGASSARLRGGVLAQILGLTVIGLTLGLTVARLASGALSSLLFGVASGDPLTFVGAAAVLAGVAVAAAWIPAWRASHIDPAAILRSM